MVEHSAARNHWTQVNDASVAIVPFNLENAL